MSYIHGDHLGSTSATSGAVTSTQTFYPFGAVFSSSGTPPTDYGFTGQKRDASANLMYYGARYYDAGLGRFTQPDTIVPNPFDPQSLNRYAYVRNNPVNRIDPTGHEDCAAEDTWCWENRWFEANGQCWSVVNQDWTRACEPEYQDKDILGEVAGVKDPAILDALWLLAHTPTGKNLVDFAVENSVQFLLYSSTVANGYSYNTNTIFLGPDYWRGGLACGLIIGQQVCVPQATSVDPTAIAHELVHASQEKNGDVPGGILHGSIENERGAFITQMQVMNELIELRESGQVNMANTWLWEKVDAEYWLGRFEQNSVPQFYNHVQRFDPRYKFVFPLYNTSSWPAFIECAFSDCPAFDYDP